MTSATSTRKSRTKDETVSPETDVPNATVESRIPEALSEPILSSFCVQYLDVLDKIAEYNKQVIAERDSEWSAAKVLVKAQELGRPTDKDATPDSDVLAAIEAYEAAVKAVTDAKKNVVGITADKLGISLSAVADRNPEVEGPLKEARKVAIEIGNTMGQIAKLTTDPTASKAVTDFLEKNPLPAVGRDQVRSFGADGKSSTPKYRVTVEVSKDDEVLISEDGFTKTALALTKLYPRGKAPKPEMLRQAWESAGNTSENTATPVVTFEDSGYTFTITKK